ncbi:MULTISPECIES: GNAT family N-acetyltransferase [Nocardia]|uniref:GNAT family N-acetyltransferase n=1 Tax=Nocardia TaxID=1817 RepID=UPI00135B7442|nr:MULTISPECIES: GNAT family N-acetyltransferase [Nocardia]
MLGTKIVQALLLATEKLDFQATRVARHLADTTRGKHIGAQALETVSQTYTDSDLSNAAILERWNKRERRVVEEITNCRLDRDGAPVPYYPLALSTQQPLTPTEVQQLTADDWQLNREITLKMLASAPDDYKTTLDEALERTADEWRRHTQSFQAKFVALQDGKLVGAVAVVEHDRPDTVEMVSMFVVPEARGSGAADHLVEAVVDWSRNNGYRRVALSVREENLPADGAYRRHGFGWTGREEEGPRGLRVEMHRLLGESTSTDYDSNGPRP